jgi:transcriptional/translational regulatory protein YebC/TACO1
VGRLAATGLDEEALLEVLLRLEAGGGPIALGYEAQADGGWEVSSSFAALEALQDGLRTCALAVESWEQRWIPQTSTELQDLELLRSCLRMLDALEDLDDVRSVTSNLEADEALLNAVLG